MIFDQNTPKEKLRYGIHYQFSTVDKKTRMWNT